MIEGVRLAAWAAFMVLFGVFAWTDLRVKKIRNGALAWGLASALTGYAALAFWTWRAEGMYLVWPFYGAALAHAAAAWAAGLALWQLRLWPAGDAKLFMMLGTLFPLLVPQTPLAPWRATLSTLMNCFIPAALGIVVSAFVWLWRTRVARRIEAARVAGAPAWGALGGLRLRAALAEAAARSRAAARAAAATPFKTLWRAADWAGFFAAAAVLLALITARYGQSQWTGLALCGFSFFVWSALGALLGPVRPAVAWGGFAWALASVPGLDGRAVAARAFHLAVFGGAIGAGVQALFAWMRGGAGLWWAWAAAPLLLGVATPWLGASPGFLLLAALLGAGAAAVAVQVREDTLDWKADAIEPYLVLTAHSLEVIGRDPDFAERYFDTRYADGLTRDQAKLLKAWCSVNKVPSLTMQRTLSFAVWIFAGYALTAWLQADVVSLMARRAS
ncbi:MAG: hypothetical protein HYZ75_06655 [Elusimicrobia bacterium]|nr:hypothetical protein [Elusimicrobiota bacterium]